PPSFQTSVFAKKSCDKQTLVILSVRKFSTALPQHLLKSSGVRPNEDGTYHWKSVEILENDTTDTHSLRYLYTIQSKSSPDRGYGFSVVTLLDDEQIDSYNSISTDTGGTRTPKQEWLRKMKEREWIEGTDKLKYDGQELNQVLESHMKAFRHRES
ncbi:hypothetical protein NFI96_001442, partial [Prochilodus magdalenae]